MSNTDMSWQERLSLEEQIEELRREIEDLRKRVAELEAAQ